MSISAARLQQLAAIAAEILDEFEPVFSSSLGADIEIRKGIDDYATTADLRLEREITRALLDRTDIPVHGEEFGGADLRQSEPLWVLDPIDGTANYLHEFPMTGINLALLVAGEPVLGLTWLPLTAERYLAIAGVGVVRNGVALPRLKPQSLADSLVVFGNLTARSGTHYPRAYRLALLNVIVDRAFRVRMLGSSAVEMAWVAAGRCGAAIQFGGHPWDVAPGICQVRAVGGQLLTIEGREYDFATRSIVPARPGVAEELAVIFADLGDPADYA